MLERMLVLSKNHKSRPTGEDDVGGGGMAARRRRRLAVQSSQVSSITRRRFQFGRVEIIHQKVEGLDQKIVQLDRSNEWEAILALFRQEEEEEREEETEPEPVVNDDDDRSDSSSRLLVVLPPRTRTAIRKKTAQGYLVNLSTALSQLRIKAIPSLQKGDRRHHPALHRIIIDRIANHMDQHNNNNDYVPRRPTKGVGGRH
jgi:hypothetical protein